MLAAAALGLGAVPFAVTGLAAACCRRAILLAIAAGLADAGIAVTTMAFTHALGHGLNGVVTSWPSYALMLGGPCSLLLTQTAYQVGLPMITLPAVTVVTPMASLAAGAGLLGETARLSAAGAVAVGFAVLVTVAGLATLARIAAHPEPVRAARQPRAPRVRSLARQFLAGASIPAAGNITFWTFPVWEFGPIGLADMVAFRAAPADHPRSHAATQVGP